MQHHISWLTTRCRKTSKNSGASASFNDANDAYLVSFDGGFKQYEGLDFLHLKI